MQIRPLIDEVSHTRSWLVWDGASRDAILIDPVRERVERDAQLIRELGLNLVATLETHVHADHVTGAAGLRAMVGSRALVPQGSEVQGADGELSHGDEVVFGACRLEVRATPGHTDHCVTFVSQRDKVAFTGDALLIRGNGRTDFQSGDPARLYRSVREEILSLSDDTRLFPAHDYQGRLWTTVSEERRFNKRISDGVGETAFVSTMRSLKLPYPRLMDVAVPGNLVLGRFECPWADVDPDEHGVAQVPVARIGALLSEVRVVDVREPHEWVGPLGQVDGVASVPLGEVEAVAESWDPTAPVALLCRSGQRSDRAARALVERGFAWVANLSGGMLALREAEARQGRSEPGQASEAQA